MTQAQYWPCRTRRFDLSKPLIMGILNVTPDSFSDGGQHNEPKQAIAWAMRMAQDGADIIDVGGESTRPGAAAVSEEEELRRVIPVVQALASRGLAVSVDTSRARVMREAVAAGAEILNDVRAFTLPGAVEAAVETGAGLIVMHGWDAAKETRTGERLTKCRLSSDICGNVRTCWWLPEPNQIKSAGIRGLVSERLWNRIRAGGGNAPVC